MTEALALIVVFIGADYLLVAIAVFIGGLMVRQRAADRIAAHVGTTSIKVLLCVALNWPWLGWRALTGRGQ